MISTAPTEVSSHAHAAICTRSKNLTDRSAAPSEDLGHTAQLSSALDVSVVDADLSHSGCRLESAKEMIITACIDNWILHTPTTWTAMPLLDSGNKCRHDMTGTCTRRRLLDLRCFSSHPRMACSVESHAFGVEVAYAWN